LVITLLCYPYFGPDFLFLAKHSHGSSPISQTEHRYSLHPPASHLLHVPLLAGIPQGSGLGPVQFISYAEKYNDHFFHIVTSNITCSQTIPSYTITAHCETFLSYSVGLLLVSINLPHHNASHRLQLNATKTFVVISFAHPPAVPCCLQKLF